MGGGAEGGEGGGEAVAAGGHVEDYCGSWFGLLRVVGKVVAALSRGESERVRRSGQIQLSIVVSKVVRFRRGN